MKLIAWILAVLVVATVVGVIVRSGDDGASPARGARLEPRPNTNYIGQCGVVATPMCVPDVAPRGPVTVRGLTWRVVDVSTAEQIGSTAFATGVRARGRYVLATVRVRSDSARVKVLSRDVVSLVSSKGRAHALDAEADGLLDHGALLPARIDPGGTLERIFVFDLPDAEYDTRLRLRFVDPADPTLHAFIRPLAHATTSEPSSTTPYTASPVG